MLLLQVPLLLKDMHIEMRTLGAELLAVFTRVQSQVDCQLNAIQVHVPQVWHPSNKHTLFSRGWWPPQDVPCLQSSTSGAMVCCTIFLRLLCPGVCS